MTLATARLSRFTTIWRHTLKKRERSASAAPRQPRKVREKLEAVKGHKLVLRADGARGSTADTGRRKAYTALITGMSSGDYGASVGYPAGKPTPQLPGKPIGLPPGVTDENLIVAEGGLPLKNAQGKIIGAISVSGALERKDGLCAQAALDKVAPLLK